MTDQRRVTSGRPKSRAFKAVYLHVIPGPYFLFLLLPFAGTLLVENPDIGQALGRLVVLYAIYVVVANVLERTSLRGLFGRERAGDRDRAKHG